MHLPGIYSIIYIVSKGGLGPGTNSKKELGKMENGSHFGVRLKWLGCACFELDFNGFTVVTDPWISDNQCTDLTW